MLKEWIYQKRWMFCFFLSAVCFPFGLIASLLTAKYDYDYRYEQSKSGFKAGFAALAVASVETVAACITSLGFYNIKIMIILSILAALTGGWGAFSIIFCKKTNDRIAYFDYFDNIIEVHHITSVAEIAKIIGKSNDFTIKILRDMIDRERLEKAAVSGNLKEVIVYRKWYKQTFLCQNCGAEYSINIGNDVVCPYCGSPSTESYLGDISDNVKTEKALGPLVSAIRRNTLFCFWAGGIIQILSYILVVLVIRNQRFGLIAPVTLFLIGGVLMTILSFIYGNEEQLEKIFDFFHRHRIINSFIQWVSGFVSFYVFTFGIVMWALTLTDNMSAGNVSVFINIILTIIGFIVMLSGFISLIITVKVWANEQEYW